VSPGQHTLRMSTAYSAIDSSREANVESSTAWVTSIRSRDRGDGAGGGRRRSHGCGPGKFSEAHVSLLSGEISWSRELAGGLLDGGLPRGDSHGRRRWRLRRTAGVSPSRGNLSGQAASHGHFASGGSGPTALRRRLYSLAIGRADIVFRRGSVLGAGLAFRVGRVGLRQLHSPPGRGHAGFGSDVLSRGRSSEAGGAARADRALGRGLSGAEEYVTDDTGLIAVTIDMSRDPYGGFRLERKVCRGAAATATGYLAFAGCKLG
jgi:hypothetical protein